MRVEYSEVLELITAVLLKKGFTEADANLCATILADNTLCGVASHGINRLHVICEQIDLGLVKPGEEPTLEKSMEAFEVWDGHFGVGMKNAWLMTERAMKLAKRNGIGCIALRDTNHWMRAGTYGHLAAEKGFILICWTNTIANLPPWGAKEARTGNNPIVFAVPRNDGPVVIDMALSQYSYGKLSSYQREGKPLPFVGGYDSQGELTTDASEIYSTFRGLPIGLWKGAGLSLVLDLIAAVLSGGKTTKQLSEGKYETGLSQVFIAIDPMSVNSRDYQSVIDETIAYYTSAERIDPEEPIIFPGERVKKISEENLRFGIPVEVGIWERVHSLL